MITSLMESQIEQARLDQRISFDMLQDDRVELAQELLDEQGQLIDWLIGFAFDTLGTRVLDLRVVRSEPN
jgi:hypothetical protein